MAVAQQMVCAFTVAQRIEYRFETVICAISRQLTHAYTQERAELVKQQRSMLDAHACNSASWSWFFPGVADCMEHGPCFHTPVAQGVSRRRGSDAAAAGTGPLP